MQFKCSYILDVIANQISTFEGLKIEEAQKENHNCEVLKIRGLLKQLAAFNVDGECFNKTFEYKNLNPILSTVNNIITRGLPTKAPVYIEEELATVIGITQRDNEKKSEICRIESSLAHDHSEWCHTRTTLLHPFQCQTTDQTRTFSFSQR